MADRRALRCYRPFRLGVSPSAEGWTIVAVAIVAAVVVALLLVFIVIYNQLVRARFAVNNAWAQIDVQLKRRFDLVPNLVSTVQGYAAHERLLFETVTQLRALAMQTQAPAAQGQLQSQLQSALRGIFAVAEQYPDLKASANFLELQEQLSDTENRIAFARQFYNDAVYGYNRRVSVFPSNVVAEMMGFRLREFFQADVAPTTPVPVSFGA
jgi:LemA protein